LNIPTLLNKNIYRRKEFYIMSLDENEPVIHPVTPEAISKPDERFPTDRASLERDCDLDFFIASGPGGQNRNKVETGVRLVHRPTGITVTATERRSQHANREAAFERMAERIQVRQQRAKPRKATRPTTASRIRRVEAKRHNALRKKLRNTPAYD
jgi:protein subunit release factor B